MMGAMEQRVAVVTGGAGGLGQSIVSRLVADGLRVAAADLDPGPVEAGDTMAVAVDVADADSAQAMADAGGHGGAGSTCSSTTPASPVPRRLWPTTPSTPSRRSST